MARWIRITSLLVLVQACSHRPWVTEAQSGNLPNLKRYVEVAAERHQFDRRRVEQLAETIAVREIGTADDAEAYDRVVALGPCASELYTPLLRQSLKNGDTAAAAAMTLLAADLIEPSQQLRAHASDADGAWRAVGIRASQRLGDRAVVYRGLIDPDARVRYAAIATIGSSPLFDDARQLLEVVRLDPEDALRATALATLAETGDLQSILLARDLWDGMPEALRGALLQAFDSPALRGTVGLGLLARTAQADDSMMGEVAASLLYKHEQYTKLALGLLARALRSGTTSEQLLALATLGLREVELRPQVERLARDGALYVRVAALGLLLDAARGSADVHKRLAAIATSRDADADEADRVLAEHADVQAMTRVERQLTRPSSSERMAAARLLLKLQRWDAVARALTDDHPAVRLATACSVLSR